MVEKIGCGISRLTERLIQTRKGCPKTSPIFKLHPLLFVHEFPPRLVAVIFPAFLAVPICPFYRAVPTFPTQWNPLQSVPYALHTLLSHGLVLSNIASSASCFFTFSSRRDRLICLAVFSSVLATFHIWRR